jgi:hypothetical protein
VFDFELNAYWLIDQEVNACYIRTVGVETVDAILHKYKFMPSDPRWNKETILINDYVDIDDAKLSAHDIIKVSDLHEATINNLGTGKWYFITNKTIHYGIIRMYSLYINDPNNPQIIVCRNIEDIPDKKIRAFAAECREECRIFEKLTKK